MEEEMTTSLVQRLRDWSQYNTAINPCCNLLIEAAERIDLLEAEITRCHARLEIDHVFRLKDGKLIRVEVPMAERLSIPDAVTCRDATIDEFDRQRKTRPISGTG